MTRTRFALLILSAALLAGLAGCDLFGFRTYEWHQKITVIVDTPDGSVSGSAVTAVTLSVSPKWFGLGDVSGAAVGKLAGEAVVVEVLKGRYLFALLRQYDHQTALEAFGSPRQKVLSSDEVRSEFARLEKLRDERVLSPDNYPDLATIDDVGNPASINEVDPRHLDLTFGPGVRLKAITISLTDDPVTKGNVEAVLGPDFFKKWSVQMKEYFKKNGPFVQPPFAFQISPNDFVTRN